MTPIEVLTLAILGLIAVLIAMLLCALLFLVFVRKRRDFGHLGSERYEIPGLNYSQYGFGAWRPAVLDIIDRAELEHDIRLTRAAREM